MFDVLATQLINGTPETSAVYRTADGNHRRRRYRPVKIRNVISGVVTTHPSIYDTLEHYPKIYPQIVNLLIKDPERIWNDLQAKEEGDITPWHIKSTYENDKPITGRKNKIIHLTNKKTGATVLRDSKGAMDLLQTSNTTISKLLTGTCSYKDMFSWVVRYATREDLKAHPEFKFVTFRMVLHVPKGTIRNV